MNSEPPSICHLGYDTDDARDLTQGFFLHLLDRWALARVDPLKGKLAGSQKGA